MNSKPRFPIILCAGKDGRALIYGYVETEPTPGEPVKMNSARMVIYYPSGGSLGLGSDGPPEGSRVTRSVNDLVESVWQEWFSVSPKAAEVFDAWD